MSQQINQCAAMTGQNDYREKMEDFVGTLAHVGQVLIQLKISDGKGGFKEKFTVSEGTGQLIK